MNCILVDKSSFLADGNIELNERQSKHVIDVLGKKAGDSVLAGIVDGPIGMTRIVSVDDEVVVIENPVGDVPPKPPVHLILAMPRPKVMKRLWPTIATLGIGSIAIIGANRVERYYFDSQAARPEHFRPLLIEGLEQARDTRLPDVYVETAFRRFAANFLPSLPDSWSTRLICHPGDHPSIRAALDKHQHNKDVVITIGPEGGWTEREIGVFQDHGFKLASFRDRALRTDTAVTALLSLVYDALNHSTESV